MPFKLTLLALLCAAHAHATIWQVGLTRQFTVPSAVANLVASGDTVDIDAGLYSGNVATWNANNLLLRSVGGGYAHLAAAGNNAGGKAIWVIKGSNCTVEGIEFSGCQVPDHNGAGIRQEGQHLTLRHCYFHHNEMGILTSNDGVSDYLFESCEFASNGYGDGYSHNIYVGHANSLTLRFCYSHDAHTGHLVKSRAKHNYLYFNRLTGETGDGSYEVDLPNGGEAVLLGNVIEQAPSSQNGGIVAFGLEGATNPDQQIVLAHNTVVNDRFDGRFLHVSNQTTLVKLVNNLLLGPGQLLQGTPAALDTATNLRLTSVAAAALIDPANFDFRPTATSPGLDAGSAPGTFNGMSLTPAFQYLHPLSATVRLLNGSAADLGAFEFGSAVSSVAETPALPGFQIWPNPVAADWVRVQLPLVPVREQRVRVGDLSGKIWLDTRLPAGDVAPQLLLKECPRGTYFVDIEGFKSQILIRH